MTTISLEPSSTYYRPSPATRVFRLAFAAAQQVWPALAVRAATRLFSTPLPAKWMHRHAWEAEWRIEHWPFGRASLTVYTRAVANEGPVALLVHGWSGHARQLWPLAEALAGRGLRPVLLEMPAHGRSRGSTSNLPQFARAIEYAAARLLQNGDRIGVLAAHSMGASAAAFAVSRGLPVNRLVLLAPAASPREFTHLFAHAFGLHESTRAAIQTRIETSEGVLMPQFEPAAVGPRIGVPTVVVHDREDSINRFRDGEAYARAIPGAQLVPTEGLGHRRILKDAEVLDRVARFAR